jgi:hypothetical protein
MIASDPAFVRLITNHKLTQPQRPFYVAQGEWKECRGQLSAHGSGDTLELSRARLLLECIEPRGE